MNKDIKYVTENKDFFQCPDTNEELMLVCKGNEEAEFINKFETKFYITHNFVDFVGVNSADTVTSKRSSDKKNKKKKNLADLYDEYMQASDWFIGTLDSLMWGHKLQARVFSQALRVFLTEMQSGVVLDIPIVTGLVSALVYKEFSHMKFFAADYSADCLSKAYDRIWSSHVDNAILVQADSKKLPFKDSVFDGVSSLAGVNFLKDLTSSFKSIYRVMKPNSRYLGNAYVKGEKSSTDKFVDKLIVSKGFFGSVPTKGELKKALESAGFQEISIARFEADSIVRFSAVKK